MTVPRIDELLEARLGKGLAALDAAMGGALARRDAAMARLSSAVAHLEATQERAQEESFEALRLRTQEKLAARNFMGLTRRELKVAARLLGTVSPAVLSELLQARPDGWSAYVDAFFRRWEDMATFDERPGLAALLRRAPKTTRVLSGETEIELLAAANASSLLAARMRGATLSQVKQYLLQELRCASGWQFTDAVFSEWVVDCFGRRGLSAAWDELEREPDVALRLLPALPPGTSWFAKASAPLRTGSTGARARVLVALLRAILKDRSSMAQRLTERLLQSELQDPRLPPESAGWQHARQADPPAVEAFVAELIKDDLILFFQHAMNEPDRKQFWLEYLGKIRRTLCVLAPGRHRELKTRLLGTEQGQAALARVRSFGSGDVSAFCLFFDRTVVVEFSDTGNAAYVYERGVFEERVAASLLRGARAGSAQGLKRADLRPERILHHRGWQGDAARLLARLGV